MLELHISIDTTDIDDPVAIERLHSLLFTLTEDLDVAQVEPLYAEAESGARGAGAMLLGVVKVFLPEPARTVLEPLIDSLGDLAKRTERKARIEIPGVLTLDLTDANPEQTERVLAMAETVLRERGLELR